MKLVIAEKPSVAQSLAAVIGLRGGRLPNKAMQPGTASCPH